MVPVAEVKADDANSQVCMVGKWSNAHAIVYVSRFRCRLIHLLGIKKPKFIYTRSSSAPHLEDLGPAETGVAPLFGYLVHSYPPPRSGLMYSPFRLGRGADTGQRTRSRPV